MNLPICTKCRKRLSEFNVRIEHEHEEVDGKDFDNDWARAFCPTCGSEVWCEFLEEASIEDLDKAIRSLNYEIQTIR